MIEHHLKQNLLGSCLADHDRLIWSVAEPARENKAVESMAGEARIAT
jgi:hypothetical protein